MVSFDDNIIFSGIIDELMSRVRTVLSHLHKAGMKRNLKKDKFYTKKMDHFEHGIRPAYWIWPITPLMRFAT